MSNPNQKLLAKFKPDNRYSNFGPFLRKIEINGFRGLRDVVVKFDHPVTAISGLNGTGKSTIGQLCVCAYKKPSTTTRYRRQYIKDFFPISPADPTPIDDNPSLIFQYSTDNSRRLKNVTVTRASSAWSGYKRQPERCCYYIGFTVYIPKVERRDLSVYGGKSLILTEKREISQEIQDKLSRIIGQKYDEFAFQNVESKRKKAEIGVATRFGYSYSENNMGFGEGRVLYIVDKLENSPDQSLFVIEEPETSLHENAQYELAKYLLDVSNRKHHQIILSSHSGIFMSAFPSVSRKLLVRKNDGVIIHGGISANQVKSILSGGHNKSLDICVEDHFAKLLLIEAIRIINKDLLAQVKIHEIGDTKAVIRALHILQETGKNAIAVRDADIGADPAQKIFSFPGSQPPEKEVFENEKVKEFINEKYDIDIEWLITQSDTKDHHKISEIIAKEISSVADTISIIAIEEYVKLNIDELSPLITQVAENT